MTVFITKDIEVHKNFLCLQVIFKEKFTMFVILVERSHVPFKEVLKRVSYKQSFSICNDRHWMSTCALIEHFTQMLSDAIKRVSKAPY